MLIMKNKPLIIGAIAVVALLIIGAIYFFVINGSDSEVDTNANTPNNTQEENNDSDGQEEENGQGENGMETDSSTDTTDDGSAVLVAVGFDCQTTTIAAQAATQIAESTEPGEIAFNQAYANLVDAGTEANNEILLCDYAAQELTVIVASNADADSHLMTLAQVVCMQATESGVPAESLEALLQEFIRDIKENPFSVIDSKVYFATSSATGAQAQAPQQQFEALIEAEDIEYTLYALPEVTCAA